MLIKNGYLLKQKQREVALLHIKNNIMIVIVQHTEILTVEVIQHVIHVQELYLLKLAKIRK